MKYQRQVINEKVEETLRRQHKRLIKRKRDEDKDDQEVGPTFMITIAADMHEVFVVEGDRVRERTKDDIKGMR